LLGRNAKKNDVGDYDYAGSDGVGVDDAGVADDYDAGADDECVVIQALLIFHPSA